MGPIGFIHKLHVSRLKLIQIERESSNDGLTQPHRDYLSCASSMQRYHIVLGRDFLLLKSGVLTFKSGRDSVVESLVSIA
jgi:hypothetical protein